MVFLRSLCLVAFLMVVFASCRKEPHDLHAKLPREAGTNLPPVTSFGANTGGFEYRGRQYNLLKEYTLNNFTSNDLKVSRFRDGNEQVLLISLDNSSYEPSEKNYCQISFHALQNDIYQIPLETEIPLHADEGRYKPYNSSQGSLDSIFTVIRGYQGSLYRLSDNPGFYPVVEGFIKFNKIDTLSGIIAAVFEAKVYVDKERSDSVYHHFDTLAVSRGRFDILMED